MDECIRAISSFESLRTKEYGGRVGAAAIGR